MGIATNQQLGNNYLAIGIGHTGLASDKKYQIWQQVVCLNSVTSKTCRAVRPTQFLCVTLAATPVLAIGMEVYAEN